MGIFRGVFNDWFSVAYGNQLRAGTSAGLLFYDDGSNLGLSLLDGGQVVVNDSGLDVDFRVEGDTDANLLYLDAGNGRVGIGTATPGTKLHVSGGILSMDNNQWLQWQNSAGALRNILILNASNIVQLENSTGLRLDINPTSGGSINMVGGGGNVGIRTTTFGTNAAGVLGITSGTAPTTGPVDTVQFYSSDDAVGHTIPSFYCEGTNVLATGQGDSASSVRVKMRINGTVVTLLAI